MSFQPPASLDEREAKLNTALAKAQGELKAVKKDEKADAGSFSYSYASLAQVIDAIRKPLADHGLALVQFPEGDGLHSELRHADGGKIASTWPWPNVPEKIQDYGGLVSYMRRYAILCLLGLATEDDDGASQVAAPDAAGAATKMASKTMMAAIAKMIAKLEASQPTKESGGESWADAMRAHVGGKHGDKMTAEQADKAMIFLTKADVPFG